MANQQIRFTQGISRLNGSSLASPYDIQNARISRLGEVQALTEPELYQGSVFPTGQKPWMKWEHNNGKEWITQDDADSVVQFQNRLYLCDYANSKFYKRNKNNFQHDTPANIVRITSRPALNEEQGNIPFFETDKSKDVPGITLQYAADYIFIPYNEHDEAGPWFYHTFTAGYSKAYDDVSVDGSVNSAIPIFDIETNNKTSHIEVYRSLEYRPASSTVRLKKKTGSRSFLGIIGPRDRETHGVEFSASDSGGYYYADKVSVQDFEEETTYDPVKDQVDIEWKDSTHWPFDLNREDGDTTTTFGQPDVVGPVMEKEINMWSRIDTLASDPVPNDGIQVRSPVCKKMFHNGGRVLFGNAKVPTKQPILSTFIENTGGAEDMFTDLFEGFSKYKVAFQYEYSTEEGTVYGPPLHSEGGGTYPDNCYAASVPYQGEEAVHVFVYDSFWDRWVHNERLTPDANLNYTTRQQYRKNDNDEIVESDVQSLNFTWCVVGWTYDEQFNYGDNPRIGFFPTTDYIEIENAVFLSEVNRPWEITFLNAPTPDYRPIRHIGSARLAEEENIKQYSFYVFTDKNVYVGDREDDTILYTEILSGVGVKNSSTTGHPLHVPTLSGAVMIGTDNRVYALSGRNYTRLDIMIPDLFGDITDLAYHPGRDEIYVLENGNVWIYNFEQTGWTGHMEEITDLENLQYSEEDDEILLRTTSGEVYEFKEWDESGVTRDAKIVSQDLDGVVQFKVKQIKVDYDPVIYNGSFSADEGSNRILRDSNDPEFVAARDELAQIYLSNGGEDQDGNDTALMSMIAEIDGDEAVLSDYLRIEDDQNIGTITGTMQWGPSATIKVSIDTALRSFSQSFKAPPNRTRYPRLKGRKLQIEIEDFDILREILILSNNKLEVD